MSVAHSFRRDRSMAETEAATAVVTVEVEKAVERVVERVVEGRGVAVRVAARAAGSVVGAEEATDLETRSVGLVVSRIARAAANALLSALRFRAAAAERKRDEKIKWRARVGEEWREEARLATPRGRPNSRNGIK